ncbi:MAG: MFS transporter [Clostridia bacterium]|nr:MFS transporter [Clostridia bacterium]
MEDCNEAKRLEKNIKIYKKYKMFSYDFVFYYAIFVIYFTTVKNFSMSQVMYFNGFYTFFVFFWQMFGNLILEKIKIKKSIVLGNVLVALQALIYIFGNYFSTLIFAECIGALGFTLKSLSEGTLLYTSLKHTGKRKEFTKIEGKANSKYYYYDAIASILSGLLFLVSPYLPIILCFINTLISLVMSLKFSDIEEKNKERYSVKEIVKDFKTVIKKQRVKSIILFSFVFSGVIAVSTTLYKAIILEMGVGVELNSVIICICTIFVGIGAKQLFFLEAKTKNRTLTFFAAIYTVALLSIGFISHYCGLNIPVTIVMITLLIIIGLIQGAYRVAIKKYVLNFTTSKVRTKITSIYYMAENIGSTIMLFLIGILLNYTTSAMACILFSVISGMILLFILLYIKNKLGLKPEEYDAEEINNTLI